MAIFYPSLEEIKLLKRTPEAGELKLLDVLCGLPDSCEVYFQPFLNGDRPDVIIVKKGYGVLIVEVKDWTMEYYFVDERGKWYLKKNKTYIKSPADQVYAYKKNIFQLHIAAYIEKTVYDAKFWGIVKCAVFFSKIDRVILDELVKQLHSDQKRKYFLQKNVQFWDSSTNLQKIQSVFEAMKKSNMGRFGEEEYHELTHYLRPTEFDYEQFFTSKPVKYTTQQRKLIVSEPRDQWIKGVVGSGKTTVLSARAAEAFTRVNKRILILTYNMTLNNYIHDKISRVRGKFDSDKFYVIHYDQFISTQMNNYELDYNVPKGFDQYTDQEKNEFFASYHDNLDLFETVKDIMEKYPVILIDEVQDFKKVWLDIVKKYFLEPNGEYVLYSDEKQNIYNRTISGRDITTNVAQKPTTLKESIRSRVKLKEAFIDFQKRYFVNKYDVDERDQFLVQNPELSLSERILYYNLESGDIIKLFNRVNTVIKSLKEHPKSVAVLGETIDFLRDFDLYYRVKTNEKTNTMFESAELRVGVILNVISKSSSEDLTIGLLRQLLAEAYRFFEGKKLHVKIVHKRLSYLLARIMIEGKVKEDRLFKSNVEQQEPLILEPAFRYWADHFLQVYDEFSISLKSNDPFKSTIKKRLKDVRDGKKNNFWFHSDGVKISTIQSFKGWEAGTLFLVIEPGFRNQPNVVHELIYTSITRARNNLVILNLGNESFEREFKPFFSKHTN
jgi:hypothetical protein